MGRSPGGGDTGRGRDGGGGMEGRGMEVGDGDVGFQLFRERLTDVLIEDSGRVQEAATTSRNPGGRD